MGQTTRNQVPISAQKKLLIPLPPLDQQRWISLLYEYQKLIMREKKIKLVALENLRFSLVSELLSGRKRVIV
jgi:type I restriction enzyme S subunit